MASLVAGPRGGVREAEDPPAGPPGSRGELTGICGTVTTREGRPLPGVTVTAWYFARPTYDPDLGVKVNVRPGLPRSVTDEKGAYLLRPVLATRMVLQAWGKVGGRWFNGTVEAESVPGRLVHAEPIILGDETAGNHFRGRVTLEGHPVEGAQGIIYPEVGRIPLFNFVTDSDGRYEVNGLTRPGNLDPSRSWTIRIEMLRRLESHLIRLGRVPPGTRITPRPLVARLAARSPGESYEVDFELVAETSIAFARVPCDAMPPRPRAVLLDRHRSVVWESARADMHLDHGHLVLGFHPELREARNGQPFRLELYDREASWCQGTSLWLTRLPGGPWILEATHLDPVACEAVELTFQAPDGTPRGNAWLFLSADHRIPRKQAGFYRIARTDARGKAVFRSVPLESHDRLVGIMKSGTAHRIGLLRAGTLALPTLRF